MLFQINATAVDKETFVALNNKARIPEWTNHKYLPEREIVSINDFKARIKEWDFPFVIKPGDDLPKWWIWCNDLL